MHEQDKKQSTKIAIVISQLVVVVNVKKMPQVQRPKTITTMQASHFNSFIK